jgi:hypothetical protein
MKRFYGVLAGNVRACSLPSQIGTVRGLPSPERMDGIA